MNDCAGIQVSMRESRPYASPVTRSGYQTLCCTTGTNTGNTAYTDMDCTAGTTVTISTFARDSYSPH